jgi:hypothetical protein
MHHFVLSFVPGAIRVGPNKQITLGGYMRAQLFRCLGVFLTLVFLSQCALALDSKRAQYVGGTAGVTENAEAVLNVSGTEVVTFQWKQGKWEVPYSAVTGLSYGQHAGRRVGVAIAISPLALFSKKRRHYLTIEYTDAQGKNQAAIFEIGKDAIRTTLTIMEVRTGKTVEYEDDEARKAGTK